MTPVNANANADVEIPALPMDAYHGRGGTFVIVNGVRVPSDPVTGLPTVSDEDPGDAA